MKKGSSKTKRTNDLRKRVEKKISESTENVPDISDVKVKKLVHDLQVHQIELEMQNEALQKSQMETEESHRKYTDLYDFAPIGYFTLNKKGHIIEANITGASLLGFEKRSLAGQPFHRFITPGHFSIFLSHLQKAIEIKSKQTCKLKLTRKDGSLFDALIETIAIIGSNGKFDHYRSSVTDITEITEAELEMARLASFPMINPNPIAEVDFVGQVYYLNPAAEQLFPDLRKRGPKHPWLADWESLVRNLRAGGEKTITREVKVGRRWCQQMLHLVEDTQRIRIYGMNITELKQAEKILEERTAQLEEANKGLESFSYSVSHDLRAPLRAIDGYARMILKKHGHEFDEDTLRKFNVIRSSAHMMGQLIDDLLTFSRLGRKQMSMSKIDMEQLINDVWKELQTNNPDRNMELTLNGVLPGYGDRALIKQVYINLLSNAVKFTKKEDAACIEAGGYTEGNEDVYYVRDNGIGLDMAYYDKLFGVFQRLHSGDDFEGTGVGLATVQHIIHRHGGRVWAEGKVNEGATFYFTLPHNGDRLIS